MVPAVQEDIRTPVQLTGRQLPPYHPESEGVNSELTTWAFLERMNWTAEHHERSI